MIIPNIVILFYVGFEPLDLFVKQVFLQTADRASSCAVILELPLLVSELREGVDYDTENDVQEDEVYDREAENVVEESQVVGRTV